MQFMWRVFATVLAMAIQQNVMLAYEFKKVKSMKIHFNRHILILLALVLAAAQALGAKQKEAPKALPMDLNPDAVPLSDVHPRPDLKRDSWLCLNGQWDFDFDREDVGLKERWHLEHDWPKEIMVPYVHQSRLSAIQDARHYRRVWYHRTFKVPAAFEGKRIRLHIGAADFRATVWVNGREAGTYEGGYTPFFFDITDLLKADREAENDVVVRIYDNELDSEQPRGKQWDTGRRNRWSYTHLTGIWQTVWLEAVNPRHINRYQAVTAIDPPTAELTVWAQTAPEGSLVKAILQEQKSNEVVALSEGAVENGQALLKISAPNAELWSHKAPNLYDLRLDLVVNDEIVDTVGSYLGFRTFEARDGAFFLNGEKVWLCGALDQGYWPQSLYTHPSDEAAIADIKYAKHVGLNHIRKHQMVADPRFLYHCDRLGLLVWGEMANAGQKCLSERAKSIALREWSRVIRRDFNHPSIVTWVYSNEHWMHGGTVEERVDHYRRAYHQMKQWDPTRPVIDTSGYYHVDSDILDLHCGPRQRLDAAYRWAQGDLDKPSQTIVFLAEMPYRGQPIVVSEWYIHDFDKSRQKKWIRQYLSCLSEYASHRLCAGHCYVQLYDVERERNGYLRYNRQPKMDEQTKSVLQAAHRQAIKRDLDFDWSGFIDKHCPAAEGKQTKENRR